MSIRSIFTSHEKLLAEWMVHHKFNQEIQAESFFLEESATCRVPSKEEKEAIHQKRIEHLIKPLKGKKKEIDKAPEASLSDKSSSKFDGFNIGRTTNKRNFTYRLVDCSKIQNVEKQNTATNKQHGDVWLKSHFQMTEKKTGSFLVSGWLVVSLPKKVKEEKPFAINHDEINDEIYGSTEFSVTYRLDDNLDPVESKIVGYIKSWFELQSEKFITATQACAAGATLFTVVVSALRNSNHPTGEMFTSCLVMSCIAMYALAFYSGVKLYQLYCFKEELNSVNNLGKWVLQIRRSVIDYPDLFNGAIQKFFTSQEQAAIPEIDKYNRMGYIRRLFNKNPAVHLSQMKV